MTMDNRVDRLEDKVGTRELCPSCGQVRPYPGELGPSPNQDWSNVTTDELRRVLDLMGHKPGRCCRLCGRNLPPEREPTDEESAEIDAILSKVRVIE